MLMMMHYDVESDDKLELARDASHTLPQSYKSTSALVHVQFAAPSDDDRTNSDDISIPLLFTDALVKLCLKVRCFSQIMSQSSPLQPRDWKLKVK